MDDEQAWRRFRGRMADHLATMAPGGALAVTVATAGPDDHGAGPGLVVAAEPGGLVVTTVHRDGRHEPLASGASREADRLAALAVRALREVLGCPHPAFLAADGLEVDPGAPPLRAEPSPEVPSVAPRDREQLLGLVAQALGAMFGEPVELDEDGDVPIRCGGVVAYARVLGERPVVELFAPLVLELPDPGSAAALAAVNERNRRHPHLQVRLVDDLVVARARYLASPFVPAQLRAVVAEFCLDLDDVAAGLARELGGRRPSEPPGWGLAPPVRVPLAQAAAGAAPEGLGDDSDEDLDLALGADAAMLGLLELLHEDDVADATVAALFDHDRHTLIRQLVWVRTGRRSCDGHDEERVLGHLRRALRFVSDGEARGRRAGPSVGRPRRRVEVQTSLLGDDDLGEDSLDLGWSA